MDGGTMNKHVLLTGGAGFIGSHLADELLSRGYRVRILDNLSEQVHGPGCKCPDYLNPEAELIVGDVRDPQTVRKAVAGVHAVVHLAACVGVGQSMYQIEKYTCTNNLGTAVLLESLIERPVERLVVASSMSVYGEGLYRDSEGRLYNDTDRSVHQLKEGFWEICRKDGMPLPPVPTPETKPPGLASIYALSKYDQEQMCLLTGRAYNIPTVALRLFNVFGPRQSLTNPYTGVLAIFAARLLNDNPPLIFEDGLQQRDFVSVYDVARAFRLALEVPEAAGQVFNIGSGRCRTILNVAEQMIRILGKGHLQPMVTGKYRIGDIRHCFADTHRALSVLGYRPTVDLEQGLSELSTWLEGQMATLRASNAAGSIC